MILGNNGFIRRRLPAAASWWLSGGISSANAIGVYQPIGAASLAASYTNLANPGTYDAAPGVAPTWASGTGWTFNGTTEYLTTGIIPPNDQTWSAIVRYTTSNTGRSMFGLRQSSTNSFTLTGAVAANGGELSVDFGASAVAAFAGNKAYKNGVVDAGTIPAPSGTTTRQIMLGARTDASGNPQAFLIGTILSIAIYDTTLTADQVADVTTAMNLL